jgi:hypothetical protein
MCAAATTRTAECGRANPVFWDERAEAGTSDASKPFFFFPEAGSSSRRFQRESECSISELDSIGIITGEKNARR